MGRSGGNRCRSTFTAMKKRPSKRGSRLGAHAVERAPVQSPYLLHGTDDTPRAGPELAVFGRGCRLPEVRGDGVRFRRVFAKAGAYGGLHSSHSDTDGCNHANSNCSRRRALAMSLAVATAAQGSPEEDRQAVRVPRHRVPGGGEESRRRDHRPDPARRTWSSSLATAGS